MQPELLKRPKVAGTPAVVIGRFASHGLFNEVEDRFPDALQHGPGVG